MPSIWVVRCPGPVRGTSFGRVGFGGFGQDGEGVLVGVQYLFAIGDLGQRGRHRGVLSGAAPGRGDLAGQATGHDSGYDPVDP